MASAGQRIDASSSRPAFNPADRRRGAETKHARRLSRALAPPRRSTPLAPAGPSSNASPSRSPVVAVGGCAALTRVAKRYDAGTGFTPVRLPWATPGNSGNGHRLRLPDRRGQTVRGMVMPGTKPEDFERLRVVTVMAVDFGTTKSYRTPCRSLSSKKAFIGAIEIVASGEGLSLPSKTARPDCA